MTEERKVIVWTPEMGRRFKADYAKACLTKTKYDTFVFDGNEFVLGYAKYLIQYLETKWGRCEPR